MIKDVTGGNTKIKQGDANVIGRYPVIDQGQQEFSGYVDDDEALCKEELPAILFGDHTKIFKFIDYPFVLGADGVKVLSPKIPMDKKFLFYFLNTIKLPEDVGYSRHYKFLKEAVIPVPPLAEQKRIAAILDKADSLRRKRQQAIQLADQFLRAVFLDMFGDPVTNPKGWELKELGSLATIRRGASPRPIKNYLNGTIPWIKIGDGSKGNQLYLEKTAECVTEDGAAKSVYLEPGSLIFANCGVSLGFARILKVGGCIHDGWLSIENLHSSVNKIFLLKWINQLTNHFRNIAPDGTQPNLNTGIMKAQKLMLPPIEMQNQFEKIVHSNELFLEKIIGSRKEGNELFYAISQKAFAGEL